MEPSRRAGVSTSPDALDGCPTGDAPEGGPEGDPTAGPGASHGPPGAQRGAARVTLVVAVREGSQFLGECLASLLSQTFADWEARVVDAGCPEPADLERAVARCADARVAVLPGGPRHGLAAARNAGFRAATSALVLALDPADRLTPDALRRLVEAFEGSPELDVAYTDQRLFGRAEGVRPFPGPPDGHPLLHPEHSLPPSGVLLRRALWERLGGYDEAEALADGGEDLEFWIRAHPAARAVRRLAEPVLERRVLHRSFRGAFREHEDAIADYVLAKHRRRFDEAGQGALFRSAALGRAARGAYLAGDRGRAFRLALAAWRQAPTRGRLVAAVRSALPSSLNHALDDGALRRALPFVGYPLHGKRLHRPFFVIGAGRSGNTLLRRILTSHSRLHVPPESFVLGRCIRLFRAHGRHLSWPDLVALVLAQFELHPEFHLFEVELAPLFAELRALPREQRDLADVLDRFYRHHAESQGKDPLAWGDKTPMNSLDDATVAGDRPARIGAGVPETLERLLRVFPDARFVHVYRDGCDVAYSSLRGGFFASLEDAALRWLHVEEQTRRFAERHAERSHEVRYEDLVQEPERVVRGLCAFLQVEFEPAMLSSEDASDRLGDVPAWFWHAKVARPIDARNPGKARRSLTAAQRELLQRLLGPALAARGYPPATD